MSRKKIWTIAGIIAFFGILFHLAEWHMLANIVLFVSVSFVIHNFWGYKVLLHFQHTVIPKLLQKYEQFLRWVLHKRRPYYLLYSLAGSLILVLMLAGAFIKPPEFFPDMQPNQIFTMIKLPVGTDISVTDSVTREVENRIMKIVENKEAEYLKEEGDTIKIVESVISNVGKNVSDSEFDFGGANPNKAKVTVNFVEFSKRHGINTNNYLTWIRDTISNIAGAQITVDKPAGGPPTGKPINIEVTSDDLPELLSTSDRLKKYIDSIDIPGIEELKLDFEKNKPEALIEVDRVRANREGISTAQIGNELRVAVYGSEASKYRDGEDQYPIQVRYEEDQRTNIDRLMNTKITFMDMSSGQLRQIPLSAVAKVTYVNTYGGINRKNAKRIVTISSGVLQGFNANEIIPKITAALPAFPKSDLVEIKITGEQEDQAETMSFLGIAGALSLCLIMFIMITQFNSLSKPVIIVSEVLFSIIGVLLGFVLTNMTISIIMTGMGMVALAGIVVRNGILLVEFTDKLKEHGMRTREAIIQAGKTRITPVLLTATATILGLIPLAIGFNIDFAGLFTNFSPHIHFGGDNVAFFGPLSWTIIFGLSFATFLTLIFIPVMYYIMYAGKVDLKRKTSKLTRKDDFEDLV